jgi:hypothetical protein
MTALTDHATGLSLEPELTFLTLGSVAALVLQDLEPRELRVGVEEQHTSETNGYREPMPTAHVCAPVELASAPDCAAGSGAPAGEAAVVGGRAFVGVVVIRRPMKLRVWRW